MRGDKTRRLIQVARLYYEEQLTQNEIAKRMGVSRPLVSRLLREAREQGVVEIRVHAPAEGDSPVLNQARNIFGVRGGTLLPESLDNARTNQALALAAMDWVQKLGGVRLGVGWGHIIGVLVTLLEQRPAASGVVRHVCPMVGNSGVSIRHYHSNENVRIIAQQLEAYPHYLYTPAFAETRQELELLCKTEHYQAVYREWEQLDVALVNIGNYPSTPDFASGARYGGLLGQRKAVGRILAYYFNAAGEIIQSDTDYAIQIPLPVLAKCRNVVGICSANVSHQALAGALRTGVISHVVAREQLLREVLENR